MYEPSRLVKAFYIAGFRYYDGACVLDELTPSKKLKMVAQPDNPFDPRAIELRCKKAKLGYIPRSENELFALMAFYGHADVFEVRVLHVDPQADPRNQVLVGVYVKDGR